MIGLCATAAAASEGPPPSTGSGATAESEIFVPPSHADICGYIETAAGNHGLPIAYLTRLIWRESSFRPGAVSPKGAQGIAQFMPSTAVERGLADPFAPEPAISAAASFLSDLRAEFGNLGLAAAAYNGGPQRIAGWLDGSRTLPLETSIFVQRVTGRLAGDWAQPQEGNGVARDPIPGGRPIRCLDVLATITKPQSASPAVAVAPTAPWGAQVAGHFSRQRALAIYSSLQQRYDTVLADRSPMVVGTRNRSRGAAIFFDVRIPAETQTEARDICARLKAAGAGCVVRKS